jgi:hypothetical protein
LDEKVQSYECPSRTRKWYKLARKKREGKKPETGTISDESPEKRKTLKSQNG